VTPVASPSSISSTSSALSLRANFSWTFVGNIVYAVCQWGILVVLAKLASPEKVGQFALGLAVTAPIIMFTNLKLRTVQATDAKVDFSFSDYLAHRCIGSVVGLGIILLIVLFSGYSVETKLVIVAVGVAKVVESLSDIFYGLFQSRERMDLLARSMIFKGPLSVLFVGLGLYLTGSVFWASVGLIIAWAVVFLIYDIPNGFFIRRIEACRDNALSLKPHWNLSVFLKISVLAFPLGVSMLLLSLYVNIPRYFIEYYQGEHALGIFAALAYIMVAGMTVVLALGQSVSPRLARYYLTGKRKGFYLLLGKISGIGALLGIAGVAVAFALGKEILSILYSSEYAEHADVFVWIMIAAGVSYVSNFLGFGVTATRAFHRQIIPFIIVVLVTTICSWMWIPDYGIRGAAWALTTANLVNCLLFVYVLFSLERKEPVRSAADD
jgi:O-antigen/teichoic acid export membrane protein